MEYLKKTEYLLNNAQFVRFMTDQVTIIINNSRFTINLKNLLLVVFVPKSLKLHVYFVDL